MQIKTKVLGFVGSIALLSAVTSAADIARTSDGKPDLSGFYDTATLTPLERPPEYGNNLYLTPEEAEKIANQRNELLAVVENDPNRNNPNREAPPVGGDGSPGAAGNVGGYNSFWIDAGEDSVLVDGKFRTSLITDPENGRMPPRTPEAMRAMMELFASFGRKNEGVAWWVHEGDGSGPYDDMELRPLFERCIVGFAPTAPILPSLYNNHKRIVQTPDHVMIMNEMVHDPRVVRINGEPAPEGVRKWMGDAVGRWEGDTLVVETTNFNENSRKMIPGGSPDMHLTERFTPLENGDLLYAFTVEDPATWTDTWSGSYTWPRTDEPIYEYACHEGNYSFGNIMRGARRLEADAMAETSGGQD